MSLDDVIGMVIVGTFFLLLVLEAVFPARAYPKRKLWRLRGFGFLVVMAGIGIALPQLLPMDWLVQHRLLDGWRLGTLGGVVVGYFVVSFVNYLWHRATHRFDLLWRGFHQLHHSAARLDIAGGPLFHPFDVSVYLLMSTIVTTLLLGLTPTAASLTGLVSQLYAFFQHTNVKTPRWLGYFIQRPESHLIHHQRGVHAYNYSDLPLWDLLFGSFRNPAHFGSEEVGFDPPADGRYGAMLLFRDVSDAIGTRGVEPASSAIVRGAAALHQLDQEVAHDPRASG